MRLPEDFSGARDDSHLVELWLAGRPSTTVDTYKLSVGYFFAFAKEHNFGLREVKVANLVAWVDTLGGAQTSKARHICAVKSLLTFAHRTGYTVFNVGKAILTPKIPDLVHEKIVDEETIQDVLKHATTERDRALVLLLYYSGARISEILGLRFCDIRGQNVTFVHGKGAKVRTVPVPRFVIDALLKLQPGESADRQPVFRSTRDKPLKRGTAWYVLREITDAAGTPMSAHWFRHAHASHTLDAGAPIHLVQKCLGHANVATTSRYLHVKPGEGASKYLRAP